MVDYCEVKYKDNCNFCPCAIYNRCGYLFFYDLPVLGCCKVGMFTAFLPDDPLVLLLAV